MYIEIEIPIECATLEEKKAYFRSIYEWGVENLEDLERWRYACFIENIITDKTHKLELFVENEIDGFAIKMTWS